jgi:hypothetical protein
MKETGWRCIPSFRTGKVLIIGRPSRNRRVQLDFVPFELGNCFLDILFPPSFCVGCNHSLLFPIPSGSKTTDERRQNPGCRAQCSLPFAFYPLPLSKGKRNSAGHSKRFDVIAWFVSFIAIIHHGVFFSILPVRHIIVCPRYSRPFFRLLL